MIFARKNAFLSALAICALLLTSCSSSADGVSSSYDTKGEIYSDSYEGDYDNGYYYGETTAALPQTSPTANAASGSAGTASEVTSQRKIVRSVDLSLETKQFDDAVSALTSKVNALGGYTENSDIAGTSIDMYANERFASFTFRIPSDTLDLFITDVGGLCNIVSKSENASDITDTYYDTQARLDSLLTQEKRLLEMLDGASDLEYMLKLEDKLSEVRYQIESYYSTLNRYDSYVSLSTVSINLSEVLEYQPATVKPATFGERISKAFTESWSDFADGCRNFAVSFVYAVPTLIVLAFIALLAALIIAFCVRSTKKRREKTRKIMDSNAASAHIPMKASDAASNSGTKSEDNSNSIDFPDIKQ
ncbi:MAG: DUF4349 domain-containing protein [Eubacteriales bacterium]